MGAWDNLSIREKAAMMRTAVSNGITNINDIRREYNEFAEGGPKKWTMEDEAGYREWRDSLPDNLKYTDDNIYDMVGAYQAGMQPTLEDDGKYHLGSRDPQTGKILKAPYHPTYLQALNEDARMGYYPTLTTDGTYTDTWKGNIPKEIQVPYRPYAKGGNLFDTGGPTEKQRRALATQYFWENKMDKARQYAVPSTYEGGKLPEVTITGNYSAHDYQNVAPTDNTFIAGTGRTQNPELQVAGRRGGEQLHAWHENHPVLSTVGTVAGAAPLVVAAYPFMSSIPALGEAAYTTGLTPLITEGMNVPFIANGLSNLINGNANWQTALEISPLVGKFLSPVMNLGNKIAKYARLEKTFGGVPHRLINGTNSYMDEVFPNTHTQHTVWTTDDLDYARSGTWGGGNTHPVFDVYHDPKELSFLDTPKVPEGQVVSWANLPYKFKDGKVVYADNISTTDPLNLAKNKDLAFSKSSWKYDNVGGTLKPEAQARYIQKNNEITEDLAKPFLKRDGTIITDDVVKFSKDNKYDATRFNRVYDGASVVNGIFFDYPINEVVFNSGAPKYVLPHGTSKWKVFNQLPNKYEQVKYPSGYAFLPALANGLSNQKVLGGNLFDTGGPTRKEIEDLFWQNRMDEAQAALNQVPQKAPIPIIDKELPELTVYPQRNYPDPYSIPQGEITPVTGNALSRAINNYTGELKYDLANNRVPSGKYTLPAAVLGATGAAGLAKAGEMAYAAGLTPLIMEGMNVPFAASGLDNLAHGNANWQTALEIAPLASYARPMWNAGKAIYNAGKTALYNNVDKLPWVYNIPENERMAYRIMSPAEKQWLLQGNELSTSATNPTALKNARAAVEAERAANPKKVILFKAGAEHGGRKQFAKGQPWGGTTTTFGEKQILAIPGENLPWVSGRHYLGPQGRGFKVGPVSFDDAPFGTHIDLQTNEAGFSGVNPSQLEGSVIYSPFKLFGKNFGYRVNPVKSSKPTQITAENTANVNWDADNWFKRISGRTSYSEEEAAELASHVPEYREIEKRLFDEGKLIKNSDGTIVVKDSKMSPQEYIMRQSEAFQKMNPDHHYVGVNKYLRDSFENKPRDSSNKMYEIWTNRKNPEDVEEYALTPGGGNPKSKEAEIGGKVFDVTFPKDAVQTPIIDAEGAHWTDISFDNILRDAPDILSHYTVRPSENSLPTDAIVKAAKRHGYGITNIDNVMDTYNGKLLDETIIGKNTPAKSVLGNTGTFSLEGPNKWKLYRSLSIPLTVGTAVTLSNQKVLGGNLYSDGGITYDGGTLPELAVVANANKVNPETTLLQDVGNLIKGSIAKAIGKTAEPPKVYKSLTGKKFNTRQEAAEDNWRAVNRKGIYADKPIEYTVKKGDSMWKISHENGIDLNTIRKLNPNVKNDLIHPGDKVIVGTKMGKQLYNVKKEWEKEKVLNTDNLAAIQSIKHSDNYIVIDKLNNKLNVYDKNNNLIYQTDDISTGKSGNDYNTITYVNDEGHIISGKGNESTPAGITKITGVGMYEGYPAFIRGRNSDKGLEDVASSLHFGRTKDKRASNGCVRIGGKALSELSAYIGTGTDVYTLPEKRGSRFTVKDGKLNFTADNSYGVDFGFNLFKAKPKEKYKNEEEYQEAVAREAESRKAFAKKIKEDPVFAKKVGKRDFDTLYDSDDYRTRFWDDYNVSMDKSYSPLSIISKSKSDGSSRYNNEKKYIQTLENSKERLQKKFNLDSDTYNRLASMALGIAEQETKFGTAPSYDAKVIGRNVVGDAIMDSAVNPLGRLGRQIWNGQKPHNLLQEASRGYSQIKLTGDNDEMRDIYKSLGITPDNIDNADSSALATLARLAYMYNNEVKDRSFIGANNVELDPYDALMYKWMGRNAELKDHTATPELNNYIQNVKKYQDNYNMYTLRALGGNLYAPGGPIEDPYDKALIDYVIKKEGFNKVPEDIGDGKMTLGSGLTDPRWHKLYKQKGKWTEEDNRKAVAEELAIRRKWAEKNVPNWNLLPRKSQNALLSYKYNYNFNEDNSPKMYQALRDKNWAEVARQINATSKNPKFIDGLLERRGEERGMFLDGFGLQDVQDDRPTLNYLTGYKYNNTIPNNGTIVHNPEMRGIPTLDNPVWNDNNLQYRGPVIQPQYIQEPKQERTISKPFWNPVNDVLNRYSNLKKFLSLFDIDI